MDHPDEWHDPQRSRLSLLQRAHAKVQFSYPYTEQVRYCWTVLEKKYKDLRKEYKGKTGAGLTDEERQPGVIDTQDGISILLQIPD